MKRRMTIWLALCVLGLSACSAEAEETAPQGGIEAAETAPEAVEIGEGEAWSADLDGDGQAERVELTEALDEYGQSSGQLRITDGESVWESGESLARYGVSLWLADIDGDGCIELLLCGDAASDDYYTYCWRWTGQEAESVLFSGDTREGDGSSREYLAGRVSYISDGVIGIESWCYILGTYSGMREFVYGEEGKIHPVEGSVWVFGDDTFYLETIRTLPVTVAGVEQELPAGTKLRLTGTDGSTEVFFAAEDGTTGTIAVEPSAKGWGWAIGGADESVYFAVLPYAG